MTLLEKIKNRVMRLLGFEKLSENPNSERLTFISSNADVEKQKVYEYFIWYLGDSEELLNYYTNEQLWGNSREPIYNRNRRNYFWGIASIEEGFKRVHSGIPNAIVTTLVNVIGNPKIKILDENVQKTLDDIIDANDLYHLINQQQMPLTMAQGYGAFKINFDKSLSKHPIIEFYRAEDVDFVYKSNVLVGVIFKDYYRYGEKDYVLVETRRIKDGDSLIEYELFLLEKSNDVVPVELNTIPELEGLQNICFSGYNKVLAVPSKFFFDPLNQYKGRSIYAGKVDLFDDLDQILSQDSQTVRVSTPVEYYPEDLLPRNEDGLPKMPNVYNRQYVQVPVMPDANGENKGQIVTTQPELHFDAYSENAMRKLDFILTGVLSPATLGIEVAKKDNAEAQREKEKVTIMTRDNIIERQTKILTNLFEICLDIQQYINNGYIDVVDYNIGVSFDEFANPSFENELQTLGSAWNSGEISTEKYVELLWGDRISDDDKAKEIAWLDANRKSDNLMLGDFESAADDDIPSNSVLNDDSAGIGE